MHIEIFVCSTNAQTSLVPYGCLLYPGFHAVKIFHDRWNYSQNHRSPLHGFMHAFDVERLSPLPAIGAIPDARAGAQVAPDWEP